jgi:hypothetical protein
MWPLFRIFRPEAFGLTRHSPVAAVNDAHRRYERDHCLIGTKRVLVPVDRIKRRRRNDPIVMHNGKECVERISPVMGTRDPDVLHHLLHAGRSADEAKQTGLPEYPPLMLRRMKDDALSTNTLTQFANLPDSAFTTEPSTSDAEADADTESQAGAVYAEARQTAGLAKAIPSIDHAEKVIKRVGSCVISAHHHTVIAALAAAAEARGISTCIIDGSISALQKSKRQQAFQAGEHQLAVISLAAKDGIDLTRADTLIIAERQPVPIWEEQTEARIHRVGQNLPCTFVYLHLENSIDDAIDAAVEDKRADIAHAIDGKRLPIRAHALGSMRDLRDRAKSLATNH